MVGNLLEGIVCCWIVWAPVLVLLVLLEVADKFRAKRVARRLMENNLAPCDDPMVKALAKAVRLGKDAEARR